MAPIAVIAFTLLAYGVVSTPVRRAPLSAPMLFVAVGFVTGPHTLDLARFDLRSDAVIALAEATLAVVLFSDALRIDSSMVRGFVGIPARMLGVGLPLAVASGAVVGRVLLDLDWAEAALLGAMLGATDAALGQPVITDETVPARIRASLNVESGLNDGLALPAVTVFTAIAIADASHRDVIDWARFVVEQVGYGMSIGVAVGGGAGLALIAAWRRGWMEGIAGQLASGSLAASSFVLAHAIGGNEFIATFVAGIAFRAVGGADSEHLGEFAEDTGQLLASITFVVFGSALLGPALEDVTVRTVAAAGLLLTVTRMGPIAISLIGTRLRAPTVLFLGWFGPRGLASILFALTVLEDSEASVGEDLFVVVALTVAASTVLHGATASVAARRYGAWYADHRARHHPTEPAEGATEVDHPMPRPRGTPRSRDPDPR